MSYRLYPLFSLIGILIFWALLAALLESRLFPGPLRVLEFMVDEAASGELIWHLSITLLRVCAALMVSMLVGSAIGYLMGRSAPVNRAFDPWLILFLNIPALVIIILAYVWAGLTEVAAIGAVVINKIPNVIVTIREGARAIDPNLEEMAETFRLSTYDRLRHVVLPQLQPYFAAATRSGIALIWKIVLVVELLGRSNGVGFQLHLYFQLFDVTGILGYTFAFIAVMLVVEIALVQPIERRATRWRLKPA